jgi:hypothetical protein
LTFTFISSFHCAGDVVNYVVALSVYGVSNNFIAMRNSPSTAMADKSAQVIKHGNVEKNTFAQGGIIDFQHRGKALPLPRCTM